MNLKNDAYLKTATLTFTKVCSCSVAGCVDCRSWITESDIPFHMQGPVMLAIANTVGVDMLRLLNQRYTIVTVIASAFEAPVVIQSIKENVTAAGPVNCFTGLKEVHNAGPPPGPGQQALASSEPRPNLVQDAQMADRLGRCADALTKAAEAMEKDRLPVLQLGPSTIIYDRRRFLQIFPKPEKRSWLRQFLISLLTD
ncbi:MAG: hypothetical protein WC869_00285 [Phycisphaerae bacterium]|jgi:hypothetical protein